MRKSLLVVIFASLLQGGVYQKNCVRCHKRLQVGIDKFFYRYLLTYSSEKNTKKALMEYLKKPTKQKSLLADGLIRRFGVKKPSRLKEKQLKNAIDEYWKRYNLKGKLK